MSTTSAVNPTLLTPLSTRVGDSEDETCRRLWGDHGRYIVQLITARREAHLSDAPELGLMDDDVYISKHLLPLLSQGMEELTQLIEEMMKDEQSLRTDPGVAQRFNPLIWLSQYLMRNHPAYLDLEALDDVQGARPLMATRTAARKRFSKSFAECTEAEKGRRELLRRRPLFEKAFIEETSRACAADFHRDIALPIIAKIDRDCRLQGALRDNLHVDMIQAPEAAPADVSFGAFWEVFGQTIEKYDLIRAADFESGSVILEEEARERKRAEEEGRRREAEAARLQEEKQKRQDDFLLFNSWMEENAALQMILKGQQSLVGVEETEDGGMELMGDHVVVLRQLLTLWGFPPASPDTTGQLSELDPWCEVDVAAVMDFQAAMGMPVDGAVSQVVLQTLTDQSSFQRERLDVLTLDS
ncbi:unnamed protein product [Vitrella brassicaformis CCMP3155]|uniref:Uncharacterized protein n=2 Tax=Vitrella brassicaformis TaxID=1169539 RepID=A0A0G4EF65_VITBC|nr:unnamed protein product [Vitrella brassicaformis CCMP3155]|eukprot:CEL94042.1 unnamed protein product [Vitrella brassicaformis CCMP3155]